MTDWELLFPGSTAAAWRDPLLTSGAVVPSARVLRPIYDLAGIDPPKYVDFVIAIGILIASWYLGKWLVRISGRPVARRFERPSVTRVVLRLLHLGVVALAVLAGAAIIGFEPGDILLSVTVFSAVLAVVLAPIVRRFIGGMFVLADQPYEIGDMIELVEPGTRGFVEDVTLRYTKLFTLDNTFIVIPNSNILERDIVNFSAEDQRTRQSLEVLVTYEGDLDRARSLITSAAREVEGVISSGPQIRIGSTRYPAEPRCYIDEFGDHGVNLLLRYWVRKPYHLPRVQSKVQQRVWTELANAPVEIAYPHSHLHFDDTSGELDVAVRDPGSEDGEPE